MGVTVAGLGNKIANTGYQQSVVPMMTTVAADSPAGSGREAARPTWSATCR